MDRQGATSCLLVHIVLLGTSTRLLRSFSVTEDFEPGGQPHYFAQMEPETRAAVEQTWREIEDADRAGFDPLHAVFSLAKVRRLGGAGRWENYVLIFRCTRHKFLPLDTSAPMILCHLSRDFNTEQISMKYQFMISHDYDLGASPATYDWLEGHWRAAAKEQFARINNYEQNITKHPWALKKMYRTIGYDATNPKAKPALEGLSLILEYQACGPLISLNMPEGNYVLHRGSRSASSTNLEDETAVLPPYSFAGNR